jgi:pimeloyl-ACP methyl ester carboxylesterase
MSGPARLTYRACQGYKLGGVEAPEGTVDLADGRSLTFAQFGEDVGAPFLVFHGFGGSRLSPGWMFSRSLLKAAGLRLIGVDRPGFGRSSPRRGLGFASYPGDIAELAKHLALDRFGVVGISMGSAFALACAAQLSERVTSVTILSGMGPLAENERLRVKNKGDNGFWWLARRAPWALRPLCRFTASRTLQGARGSREKFDRRMRKSVSAEDRATLDRVFADNAARAAFIEDLQESYRQRGEGMADDLVRYSRPWGFDLREVAAKVNLWHGLDDSRVPVALARRAVNWLPNCEPRFVRGGHMASFDYVPEILDAMSGG